MSKPESQTADIIVALRSFEGSDELGDGDFGICDRAADEIERLRAAIRWANGEGDSDFGDNVPDGAGAYWWRAELMRRAGL